MIAVFLSVTISYNTYAQTNDIDSIYKKMNPEEGFARQVFKTFQNNDEALYEALQPTNEEYKALLQRMLTAKVIGLSQQNIEEMIARRKKEAPARFEKDFNAFRTQAASAGVEWANAVYERYDNETMYPEEFHQKYIYGTIWFVVNGVRYLIEDVQAVEIPDGYRLQKIYRIRKAEEVN